MKTKRIFCLGLVLVLVSYFFIVGLADGGGSYQTEYTATKPSEIESKANYAYLCQASTEGVILEKNADESFCMGHLAKLMTIYLTAEEVENKRVELSQSVAVSPGANGQKGTQIWLNAGEKITINELLKSICMGNANDACFCLGESLFKSESEYVKTANETAVKLGMERTHFEDITGQNKLTVTTAEDIAILACEIAKFDFLQEYFCTWLDTVRAGQTQLVNTNRLVRSYNGIVGMKACYDEEWKNAVVAVAKRNGMTLVAVSVGCHHEDEGFSDAKNLLDKGFSGYQLFTPSLPEEVLKSIKVKNGQSRTVGVEIKNLKPILINKGMASSIDCIFEKKEWVTAPCKKGEVVGKISLVNGDEKIFEGQITLKKSVEKMTIAVALKRLWLNLLNLS